MNFEDCVDAEELKKYIGTIGGKCALTSAKDMAYDLSASAINKNKIIHIYNAYKELEEWQLTPQKSLDAIISIFNELETADQKRSFCSYSYPTFTKFKFN